MRSKFYEMGWKEAKGDPEEGGCIAFVGWNDEEVERVENFGLTSLLHNAHQYCIEMSGTKECSDKILPPLNKECSSRNLDQSGRWAGCDWVKSEYLEQWLFGCAEYIEAEILRELG